MYSLITGLVITLCAFIYYNHSTHPLRVLSKVIPELPNFLLPREDVHQRSDLHQPDSDQPGDLNKTQELLKLKEGSDQLPNDLNISIKPQKFKQQEMYFQPAKDFSLDTNAQKTKNALDIISQVPNNAQNINVQDLNHILESNSQDLLYTQPGTDLNETTKPEHKDLRHEVVFSQKGNNQTLNLDESGLLKYEGLSIPQSNDTFY